MIRGRPMPSHTAWSFEFRPPLVHPIRLGTAPFEQACSSAVGFQVGCVNHQPIRLACLARQLGEYLVEHTKPAPPDKPIVDRLVQAVTRWCITPAQPIPDDKDNPADHPPVINPRNPMRKRKERCNPVHSAPLTTKINHSSQHLPAPQMNQNTS
jgi:hypothetical protein